MHSIRATLKGACYPDLNFAAIETAVLAQSKLRHHGSTFLNLYLMRNLEHRRIMAAGRLPVQLPPPAVPLVNNNYINKLLRWLYGNRNRLNPTRDEDKLQFQVTFRAFDWHLIENGRIPMGNLSRTIDNIASEYQVLIDTYLDINNIASVAHRISYLKAMYDLNSKEATKIAEKFVGSHNTFLPHPNAQLPKTREHRDNLFYQNLIAAERARLPIFGAPQADVLEWRYRMLREMEARNALPGAQPRKLFTLVPILKLTRSHMTLDKQDLSWIKPQDFPSHDAARAAAGIAQEMLKPEYYYSIVGNKKGRKVPAGIVRTDGVALIVITEMEGVARDYTKHKTKKAREAAIEAGKEEMKGFVKDKLKLVTVDPGRNAPITAASRDGDHLHRTGMPQFHHFSLTMARYREETKVTAAMRYCKKKQRIPAVMAAQEELSRHSLKTSDMTALARNIAVRFQHWNTLVNASGSKKHARWRFYVNSSTLSYLANLRNFLLPDKDWRIVWGAANFGNMKGCGAPSAHLKLRDFFMRQNPDQILLMDEYRTSQASALGVFHGHNVQLQHMWGMEKKLNGTVRTGELWSVKQSPTEDRTVNRDKEACRNMYFCAVALSEGHDRPVGLRRGT